MSIPLMSVEIVRPPDVSDRNHRQFSNAALRAAATKHLLTKARKHFERTPENAVGGAYGVTPRTKKHQLRKARVMGHQIPRVFTGLERAHTLSTARVTATHRKSRVVYKALHPRDSEQGERWIREMEAISPEEAREATATAAEVYYKQLDDYRDQRQRVRISN